MSDHQQSANKSAAPTSKSSRSTDVLYQVATIAAALLILFTVAA